MGTLANERPDLERGDRDPVGSTEVRPTNGPPGGRIVGQAIQMWLGERPGGMTGEVGVRSFDAVLTRWAPADGVSTRRWWTAADRSVTRLGPERRPATQPGPPSCSAGPAQPFIRAQQARSVQGQSLQQHQ